MLKLAPKKYRNILLLPIHLGMVAIGLNLAGCVAVATQVASSLLTHSAERIITDAYDAKLREEDRTRKLPDTQPDQYWYAMQSSGFETVSANSQEQASENPDTPKIIIEPLPVAAELVTIEVWHLVIGEEKNNILERARLMGASHLPPQTQWKYWQVGLGELVDPLAANNFTSNLQKKPLTFLIPPDFGRVASGQHVIIELANEGEVNIARYVTTERTAALQR